jgi:hypothetical protein
VIENQKSGPLLSMLSVVKNCFLFEQKGIPRLLFS